MNDATGLNLIPIALLCTVHLAAGVSIGLFLAAIYIGRRKPESDRIASLEHRLFAYRHGLAHLVKETARLVSVSRDLGKQVPSDVAVPIRYLAKATRDLQDRTQKMGEVMPRTTGLHGSIKVVTEAEVERLIGPSRASDDKTDHEPLDRERFDYKVHQRLGRCIDHRLPRANEFETVLCHDI